jgi:peptidoglycan/xylan/chitin deacetylase (PgdA/CDA1 family)
MAAPSAAEPATPGTPPLSGARDRPLALVSFDVEEFDIPLEYGRAIDVNEQIRVGALGLERVLDLIEPRRFASTFFTTLSFAKARPDLLRRIVDAGIHEIASHGVTHAPPVEADLEPARRGLEDLLGVPVTGFRAARMRRMDPAAVARAGYVYNASENPIWMPGRYNRLGDPRTPYLVPTPDGPVLNIPASASPLIRIPLFWLALKNLPMPIVRLTTRWTLAADGAMNTYLHPWELADIRRYGLPRVVTRLDGAALAHRLAGYLDWLTNRATPARYADYATRFIPRSEPPGRTPPGTRHIHPSARGDC